VDRLHLLWLGAKARARERRRWHGRTARPGPPRVFYGRDRLPGRDEIAGGGIVKCQDLLPQFPNNPGHPNIVYLISSALPVEAEYLGGLARRAGARIVLNQNGVAYPAWHGPGWERENEPMAAVLAQADHVFYQSAFCKMAADLFLGAPRGPWEILYNPVDTSLFRPATEPPAGGGPVLLCTGSHHSFYRVQVALEVLAIVRRTLPGARLMLAGAYKWRSSEPEALAETEIKRRRRRHRVEPRDRRGRRDERESKAAGAVHAPKVPAFAPAKQRSAEQRAAAPELRAASIKRHALPHAASRRTAHRRLDDSLSRGGCSPHFRLGPHAPDRVAPSAAAARARDGDRA